MSIQEQKKDAMVLKFFKKSKVVTIEELATLLSSSLVTARRRLKQWNAYTSYNYNGRYYALPSIAKFNDYGLWSYNNILFSQHGNLKKTVIALVEESQRGLTGAQIGTMVGMASRSFLSHFRHDPLLQRESIEDRFIYFSSDNKTYLQQKKMHQEEVARKAASRLPTDAEAVTILVERIKHPEVSIEALSKKLSHNSDRFSIEAVRCLFEMHGIFKKKEDTLL